MCPVKNRRGKEKILAVRVYLTNDEHAKLVTETQLHAVSMSELIRWMMRHWWSDQR